MVTRYGPCPSLVRSRIINNLWFPPMISFFLFLFFFFFFCLHAHTPRAPRTCKCSPEALVTFSGARSVCETTFAAGHVRALFLSRRGREIWHFTSHSENRSGRCPFFCEIHLPFLRSSSFQRKISNEILARTMRRRIFFTFAKRSIFYSSRRWLKRTRTCNDR